MIIRLREEGDPSFGAWFIERAYNEFEEFRWTSSLAEATQRILESLVANQRYELLALAGDVPAGFAAFVLDDDMHVGQCLSIQWHYVLPEYRALGIGTQIMRAALRTARQHKVTLAYSHRIGVGDYAIKYRR